MTDWLDLTRRASFVSHRLIGWIFWDPVAQANLEALGVPGGMGHYVSNRGATLAPAGTDAVVAAFYTIRADLVRFALDHASAHAEWADIVTARDDAVVEGLQKLAPEICEPLAAMAPEFWRAADQLPLSGRVLFATLRQWPRSENQLASAWNAVNTIREWRGDTHFALLVAEEIGAVEAGLLHDAWMGYPKEWIPRSRGASDEEIAEALDNLAARGFVTDGVINEKGVAYRDWIEERTNELCVPAWKIVGEDLATRFIDLVQPVDERFIEHINQTAGDNWMPAARPRRR